MKNEILEFLNRHNGGKTAEIAEALAVTDYRGPLLPVITGKRRCGSALSIKARHGNILVFERRDAGGTKLFFHNLITQFVGMLH